MDHRATTPTDGASAATPAKAAREERSTTALAPEELRTLLKEARTEAAVAAPPPKMTEAIAPIVMILDRPPNVVDGNIQSPKVAPAKRVDADRFRNQQERAKTEPYDSLPTYERGVPVAFASAETSRTAVPPPPTPVPRPTPPPAQLQKVAIGSPGGVVPLTKPTPPIVAAASQPISVLPLAAPPPTPVPPPPVAAAAPPPPVAAAAPPPPTTPRIPTPPAMVAISGVPNSTHPIDVAAVLRPSEPIPPPPLSSPLPVLAPSERPRPSQRGAGGVALPPPPVIDRYIILAFVVVLAAALYTILL